MKVWLGDTVMTAGVHLLLVPLRRDDHSGVLIGAGGMRRSDWPVRVLANDVSTRIDRLHACRDKWQLAATIYKARESIGSRRAAQRSIARVQLAATV